MITAHPDDEDGATLAYESRGQGTRVSLLTLNRGEGGANVMSADFFDALGLVRTMELLAADRYYGVDQYFTRVVDYGFSKTKAESIEHWTYDRVLSDVVRAVRTVRPLVITSVFVGGPSDGHGNHQTAGAMAQEAFAAAADPNRFPEQGLPPWQALKQYARTPWFGRNTTSITTTLSVPVGTYDPLLGESYAQLAREGLAMQKSQNDGTVPLRAGPLNNTYHRFHSVVPAKDQEQSFFDGVDISLASIASLATDGDNRFLTEGLAAINQNVKDAMASFDARHPEHVAPSLASGMKTVVRLLFQLEHSNLSDRSKYDVRHELEIKRAQFNAALVEALGVSVEASVTGKFETVIPGQTFDTAVRVVNQSGADVTLDRVFVETPGQQHTWKIQPESHTGVKFNEANGAAFRVTVPPEALSTRPYFSRPDLEQSYYNILDRRFLLEPLAPYPLAAWAQLSFDGATFRAGRDVRAGIHPLVVAPAIAVSIEPRRGITPLGSGPFELTVLVHSNVKGPAQGKVRLTVPSGWHADPAIADFDTAADGQDQTIRFQITPSHLVAQPYTLTAVAEYEGREYREGYQVTGYAGLRPYYLYKPATYTTTGVDVKVAPGLQVGYIMGTGDDVPAALEHLGLKVQLLAPADMVSGDLSKFDALILGIRTYAARPELAAHNARLLEYVRNGGVVIVEYNTPEYDHNYGPFPYKMGANPEEVTDESSTVTILNPRHPIWNWPNRITTRDFEGWVEERGSKWLASWDSRYEPLLETHDPGQPPQQGGFLCAKYGKGIYIYNAYAFYRQLPEGVPGAYRIFANILSLPRNPLSSKRNP